MKRVDMTCRAPLHEDRLWDLENAIGTLQMVIAEWLISKDEYPA